MAGRIYDIKLGYSCNNKCFHCVVEPNAIKVKDSDPSRLDLNYSDIVRIMKSEDFYSADTIVLTGGEATLRRDLVRIISYINEKYPSKKLILQTNGRRLKGILEVIRNIGVDIQYVIALHSMRSELHDKICGYCEKDGNHSPFHETWTSIEEIKRLYGCFDTIARIEVVLSSLNLWDLEATVKALYKNNIRTIGISYPHLDGHYNVDAARAQNIGFSYEALKAILPSLYKFASEYSDIKLLFEEVPLCMWRDKEDNILKPIENIGSMDHSYLNSSITVNYPNYINKDYLKNYKELHLKVEACKGCANKQYCRGVWFEAVEMFGDEGFVPLTKEELLIIGR